jgi:hypothetical protein
MLVSGMGNGSSKREADLFTLSEDRSAEVIKPVKKGPSLQRR